MQQCLLLFLFQYILLWRMEVKTTRYSTPAAAAFSSLEQQSLNFNPKCQQKAPVFTKNKTPIKTDFWLEAEVLGYFPSY